MGPNAIDKMLKTEPVKFPLRDLEDVWDDFRWRRLERGFRDPCIKYTEDAENFTEAIKRACDSRGADGKMFFHQGRVWQVNRDEFAKRLIRRRNAMLDVGTFHKLWLIVHSIGVDTHGIGPITIYDVTARLAAWLELSANAIYTHGGVLDGLRAIDIDPTGRAYIPRKELPDPINSWPNLDHVEDFLCGYRVLLERIVRDGEVIKRPKKDAPMSRRNR
jgi:hypothetical protein